MKKELHDLIINGEIEKVISHLRAIVDDPKNRIFQSIILMAFNWTELKTEIRIGRLSQDEIKQERNRIIHNILEIIEELPTKNIKNKIYEEDKLSSKLPRIGLGISTALAVGYFSNFIKPISDAIEFNKILQIAYNGSTGKIMSTKNITFEVIIPLSDNFNKQVVDELKIEQKIGIPVMNSGRLMQVVGIIEEDFLKIVDTPTTINVISTVYQIFQDNFIFQISKEEELEHFANCLEILIQKNNLNTQKIKVIRK